MGALVPHQMQGVGLIGPGEPRLGGWSAPLSHNGFLSQTSCPSAEQLQPHRN